VTDGRFAAGASVLRRDVFRGKVWSAEPRRVLRDDDQGLLVACWPGVTSRAPSTWVEWLRTGDDAVRKHGLPNLARGEWELTAWVWRDTAVLAWYDIDPDFSIQRFFAADGHALGWYVNFERPIRRTPTGFDTFDLLLDLVAAPDLSTWWWKDEDEYAYGRRLGVIDAGDHHRVREARKRAVALLESRGGPFAAAWPHWRPDPHWVLPGPDPHWVLPGPDPHWVLPG
jgi:Protein of unknown function (DUF402)